MACVLEIPSKKEGIDTIIIIDKMPSEIEKIEMEAAKERHDSCIPIQHEKNASRRMV